MMIEDHIKLLFEQVENRNKKRQEENDRMIANLWNFKREYEVEEDAPTCYGI
jgi:hypothetical protein